MRRKYFILILAFLCAGSFSCFGEKQDSKVPLKQNPSEEQGHTTDGSSAHEGTSKPPPTKIVRQQQETTAHSSDQSVKDGGNQQTDSLSEQNRGVSKTVGARDPGTGTSSSETEAAGLNADSRNAGTQSTQSELNEASPKVAETEDTFQQNTDDRNQNGNINEHTAGLHSDSSGSTQSTNSGGSKDTVQDQAARTADTSSEDGGSMPRFADAVTSDGQSDLSLKQSKQSVTGLPADSMPSAAAAPESASQHSASQQMEEPTQKLSPSTATRDQPASTSHSSSQIPIQSRDPQSFALGSGGMAVDDNPDLDTLTKNPEGEGEEGVGVADFETFGEWRKKILEEENKRVEQMVKDGSGGESQTVLVMNSQKLRVNFASEKCGAKVVAFNPEMENGNHMLTANKDQYMINPCSVKKWFVVELCEPISVKTVELASLELFSSRPRTFRLSLSDRYPPKEFLTAGTFEMTPDKVPQPFTLALNSPYVKFVRIDMIDHFGKEHFCPVTLFRVFGLPMEDEDSDDDNVQHHTESEDDGDSQTLFARTKATVVNLVKKVFHKDKVEEEVQDVEQAIKENHGNISGGEPLPCDPEMENKRLPEKLVIGTPVTVVQPQPTVGSTYVELTSSAAPGEVPMVTKLDDGDQLEIEDKTKNTMESGEGGLVTLLESGSAAWNTALHWCLPHTNISALPPLSCVHNPVCQYVETLLGSPPPISRPRCLQFSSPSPTKFDTSSSTADSGLEPSFTVDVSQTQSLETAGSAGGKGHTQGDDIDVQSSSESASKDGVTQASSFKATTQMPVQDSAGSVSTGAVPVGTASLGNQPKESSANAGAVSSSSSSKDEELTSAMEASVASSSLSSSVVPPEKPAVGTKGQMVETNPASDTTPTADVDAGDAPTTTSAHQAASVDLAKAEETASQDQAVISGDSATDDLQPSIVPETTSVISPTLTRPTPVLEVQGASVGGGGFKGDMQATGTPALSPSPTSQTAEDALSGVDASVFPQMIQPTMEDKDPKHLHSETVQSSAATLTFSNTQGQQEALETQGVPEPTDQHNETESEAETEKKAGELDLVKVPLTLSAKRETAIMRLTNRIKALELNVSLSSRFLEELSARFKKQNEEMMKMLNKTTNRLNATAAASQRQASLQDSRIDQLETKLENLTAIVQNLAGKFDTFAEQMSDRQMTFTTVNLMLMVIALFLFFRGGHSPPIHPEVQFLLDTMPRRPPTTTSPFPRRNSDVTLPLHHNQEMAVSPSMKKGSSATNLAATHGGPGLPFPGPGEAGTKKKKRKKSKASRTLGLDPEHLGSAESDPELKMSKAKTTSGNKLGHRRYGSASAGFPSTSELSALAAPEQESKDVQFCLGEKTDPVSTQPPSASVFPPPPPPPVQNLHPLLPHSVMPLPSSGSCSTLPPSASGGSTKPPLPRNQRSKSLTAPPSCVADDEENVVCCDGAAKADVADSLNSRTPLANSYSAPGKPGSSSASFQLSQWFKPKKGLSASTPAVNGEQAFKRVSGLHVAGGGAQLRKGPFRGAIRSEEGKPGGGAMGKDAGKGKNGKKPWKGGHSFDKA